MCNVVNWCLRDISVVKAATANNLCRQTDLTMKKKKKRYKIDFRRSVICEEEFTEKGCIFKKKEIYKKYKNV